MSLTQEVPPKNTDENLREYLVRRFLEIGTALDLPSKFPERREMPYKPRIGDIHYFGDIADHSYDAAITTEGFWGLTNLGWAQLDILGGSEGGSAQVNDHTKMSWPQFYDFGNLSAYNATIKNTTSGFVANTWNTVTRIGGGGDVTWGEFDEVPDTAKAVILMLSSVTKSAGSGVNTCYVRPTGETEGIGSHNTFLRLDHYVNSIEMDHGWAIFPFDGDGFEMYFTNVSTGTTAPPTFIFRYRGFIE